MPRTDYHCHILPGIDDGPTDRRASVEMARLLEKAGFDNVYCTPHLIRGMHEASLDDLLRERELLQQELDREGIRLKLLLGREYYLDEFFADYFREPQLFEGTSMIMVEIPNNSSVDMVKDSFFRIASRGYTPLLAHPERCRLLLEPNPQAGGGFLKGLFSGNRKQPVEPFLETELLGYLREIGCRFQGNLGSYRGMYGSGIKAAAEYFKSHDIYTHEGTDAHSPESIKFITG